MGKKETEHENFETLKRVVTIQEGLEETWWGLQRQFSPPAPTFVVINDFEDEEQFEKKAAKKEENVEQHLKVEQLEDFSLVLIGGFFDVEVDSSGILVFYLPSLGLNTWWGTREGNKWRRVVHLPK